ARASGRNATRGCRRIKTAFAPRHFSAILFAPSWRIEMKLIRQLALAAVSAIAFGGSALAADKVIKIGALLPISGPGSYFGAQDKQGVELALEQLNKTGVNGYKFVVQYEDSSCAPLPATQAAKRLIEQFKPDVIIREECSDATLAVMPVVEQAKVPLLNAGSSSIK